jgi:ribosome maturation factor RimP
MDELQEQIENRIEALDPRVELIALENAGRDVLRLYIDHPDGVTLAHCELVTRGLQELLSEDYALEVSSPGLDRPLTKPEHYERFVGERVRIRTSEPIEGRRNFTGLLAAAGPEAVTVEHDGGRTEVPLDRVHRSNLVPDLSEVPS